MEHQVSQQPLSWTMADLSELFAGGARSGQHVTGVTVDSRLVKAATPSSLGGDLGLRFIPVAGTADGHDYVADALARGASAARSETQDRNKAVHDAGYLHACGSLQQREPGHGRSLRTVTVRPRRRPSVRSWPLRPARYSTTDWCAACSPTQQRPRLGYSKLAPVIPVKSSRSRKWFSRTYRFCSTCIVLTLKISLHGMH